MTIDERIEKLTERHEALAQSVEMLRDMVRENTEHAAKTDAQILALLTLAGLHQQRLDRLEGGRA